MMKNWLKRTLVGVAVTGALAGSVAAWSQQGPGNHGGPPSAEQIAEHQARMVDHIAKKLNLDANQKAKLQVLATRIQAARPTPAASAADARSKVEALVAGNTFDRAGAQALVAQHATQAQADFTRHIAQLQASSPALIAAFGDFYDNLNATQQQQVRDFLAHHRGPGLLPGFGGGFGPRDHGGWEHHGHGDRDGQGMPPPPANN